MPNRVILKNLGHKWWPDGQVYSMYDTKVMQGCNDMFIGLGIIILRYSIYECHAFDKASFTIFTFLVLT